MESPILKQLSIAELLDKAINLYRKNVLFLISIFALAYIPSTILSMISISLINNSRLIDGLVALILVVLAQLASFIAISELYLGRVITIQTAFRRGAKKYWSQIGLNIIVGLAMAPFFIFVAALARVVGYLPLVLILPIVIFISTRWSISSPALVIEDLDAGKALNRSWDLTKKHFWRVFGTSFAASLMIILLTSLPSIIIVYFFSESSQISETTILIITSLFENLTAIITSPITTIVNVLIYYDLRIRKEGYDLELVASNSQLENS